MPVPGPAPLDRAGVPLDAVDLQARPQVRPVEVDDAQGAVAQPEAGVLHEPGHPAAAQEAGGPGLRGRGRAAGHLVERLAQQRRPATWTGAELHGELAERAVAALHHPGDERADVVEVGHRARRVGRRAGRLDASRPEPPLRHDRPVAALHVDVSVRAHPVARRHQHEHPQRRGDPAHLRGPQRCRARQRRAVAGEDQRRGQPVGRRQRVGGQVGARQDGAPRAGREPPADRLPRQTAVERLGPSEHTRQCVRLRWQRAQAVEIVGVEHPASLGLPSRSAGASTAAVDDDDGCGRPHRR